MNEAISINPRPVSATDAEGALKTIYDVEQEIKSLSEELDRLKEKRDTLLSRAVSSNITEGGNYEILTKPRITRSVNVERFKQMFPEQYEYIRNMEITRAKMNAGKTILLKDAEGLIGKDTLAPACDMKTTLTYSVVKKYNDGTEGGI